VKAHRQSGRSSREAGSALLIAIFALLLISVVGIALLVSTGADSALAGNYRTSTAAYYAAVAGLEEARGRLLLENSDFINKTGSYSNVLFDSSGVLPAWGISRVLYITNPASGESVDPTSSNPANYPDSEYVQEFPGGLSSANVLRPFIQSDSPVPSQNLPGPAYKWVRINAVTEQSIQLDVNGNGSLDPYPLYFDPAASPKPGLISTLNPQQTNPNAVQVLEVTSLAVLPNGSQKLLQYLVVPLVLSPDVPAPGSGVPELGFPAALTMVGNNVAFQGGSSFTISGIESTSNGGCTNASHAAIGYTNPSDSSLSNINSGATPASSYTGGSPRNIANVNDSTQTAFILSQNWQTPSGLDSVVKAVTEAADVVVDGPATQAVMPAAMSAAHPMTIVVDGDLTFNSWHGTGYGILVVTGTFNYDPDATWNGIVLVVGQGKFVSTKGGTGRFNGAVLVAQTRDASGKLLPDPNLGTPSFTQTGGGGINYSSCWINQVLGTNRGTIAGPLKFRMLSFREIPQP